MVHFNEKKTQTQKQYPSPPSNLPKQTNPQSWGKSKIT